MQLDSAQIAIRERSHLEILDLGLRVVRAHAGPLLLALAIGALPVAALNYWLLADVADEAAEVDDYISYVYLMLLLLVWELPLATAPITLYLGQVMFSQRVETGKLLRAFGRALPQLLWYQVLIRALFVPLVVTWLYLIAGRPYLNEVILLERNPLRAGRPARPTTGARARAIHATLWGESLLQWLMSVSVGTLLLMSLYGSAWLLRGELLESWDWDQSMLTVGFPLALWLVIGYMAVVRFLAYLDLRIRREGWEVELLMRAEGARLERKLL